MTLTLRIVTPSMLTLSIGSIWMATRRGMGKAFLARLSIGYVRVPEARRQAAAQGRFAGAGQVVLDP